MNLNFNMSALTKNSYYQKYNAFLLPIIATATSLIIVILVILPTSFSYIKSKTTEQTFINQRGFYNQKLNQLSSLNSQDYESNLNTALQSLPGAPDIPESLSYLLNAVSANQLKLDNVSISEAPLDTSTGNVKSFIFRADISGSMDGLKNFVNSIQSVPRLMKVTDLSFSAAGSTKVLATVVVEVYYKPLPKTLPPVSQSLPLITTSDSKLLEQLKEAFRDNQAVFIDQSTPTGKTNLFQ